MIAPWAAALAAALAALWLLHERPQQREAVVRAAHELRGPLQALALGIGLERRRGEGSGRWQAMELELTRARLALNDLTGGRRCAPGPVALELVDGHALLDDAARLAAASGARISAEWQGTDCSVSCDRGRIAQVLGNLIANAIEHGSGQIVLRGRPFADTLRLEVSDDGPGLPAPVAVLARRARAGRGTRGRGLAIATAIACAHGGRLAAAPAQRGARLVLELPVAHHPRVRRLNRG